MREIFATIPNRISIARLAFLPVLWLFALLRLPVYLGWGALISYLSDILDGYVARRLNQRTALGSKLDSLADNLSILSGLIWFAMLKPEIYREHGLLWGLAIALYLASMLVGIVKFKRFANLHLESSRLGSIPLTAFVVHTFVADHYSPLLLYIAVGVFMISSAEGLLLQLLSRQVDEHMRSIVLVWWRQYTDRRRRAV
jgi:CDP-diacylglycerol--glycerol-3-phosphate 3-phosphatidyltransferase